MLEEILVDIGRTLHDQYWRHIWDEVASNPELESTVPAFLLNPERVIFYLGREHFAVEYVGPESRNKLEIGSEWEVQLFDYMSVDDFLESIIGFSYDDATNDVKIPLIGFIDDLYAPTNRADEVLRTSGWDYAAQSMILHYNNAGFFLPPNHFTRIVNSFFYDADDSGLIVRHIKWLDILPVSIVDEDEFERVSIGLWQNPKKQALLDARSTVRQPPDFQFDKLRILNRFVELFSSSGVDERKITDFLSQPENRFILKMAFFAKEIYAEKHCKWAHDQRKPIRPDFLVERPNGYSDIVEFKLPDFGGSSVVGSENREKFSAKINSYISQTRTYAEYFEDPRNREYVRDQYDANVLYPRRYLVIGRRWMFSSDEWKRIENDFSNISIRTYDDIVDGVRGQLYS